LRAFHGRKEIFCDIPARHVEKRNRKVMDKKPEIGGVLDFYALEGGDAQVTDLGGSSPRKGGRELSALFFHSVSYGFISAGGNATWYHVKATSFQKQWC